MRGALIGTHRSARAQLVFHGCHGVPEVLLRPGPARGIDAGVAIERIDGEPGIVRECGQARCRCRGPRLDVGILRKARARLFRLGQAELALEYVRVPVAIRAEWRGGVVDVQGA